MARIEASPRATFSRLREDINRMTQRVLGIEPGSSRGEYGSIKIETVQEPVRIKLPLQAGLFLMENFYEAVSPSEARFDYNNKKSEFLVAAGEIEGIREALLEQGFELGY